ncbi:MAG TPA: ABC transporter permease [Thermoplasmata archaeon]|nr:ABC transporter permease [Thermoplasmata archaeon]
MILATREATPGSESYSLFRERLLLDLSRGKKMLLQILRNKLSLAGVVIILFFVCMALFATLLVGPYQSALNLASDNEPPSAQHLLGTDGTGHDILNLLVYGTQVDLIVGFAASLAAMILGTTVGLVAGYYGRVTDQVLSRMTDFFLVIPWLPFVLVLVSILEPSLATIVFAIALVSWPTTARVIRSQVLSLKERQFIERAKAVGAGRGYIIARHILPNVMPLVWAEAVLTVSGAIFTEAFLSFFGLGPPGVQTWGQMVNLAYNGGAMLSGQWWYFLPPGVCITTLVLGFALLGYGIEEVLNPALKRRGGAGA